MQNDLKSEVFEDKTVEMIENIRIVCDLKTLLINVKKKGAVIIGYENGPKFLNAVRSLTGTLKNISDDDLLKVYRLFLVKMEKQFGSLPDKSLTSSSMIQEYLSATNCLSNEVELIVHCISVAVVKISVESVVESLVSRYEKHFPKERSGTEESHALEEMVIAENGPLLQHADSIIEASMNEYWKEKAGWHFIWKSDNIKQFTGNASKVIGRFFDTKSKLPFMK